MYIEIQKLRKFKILISMIIVWLIKKNKRKKTLINTTKDIFKRCKAALIKIL